MFCLCRLCAKYTEPMELIIDVSELESKLSVCCGWKPSVNEEQFPQKACNSCVDQLQRNWTFAESVLAAEEQLIKLISELSQADASEPCERISSLTVKQEPEICLIDLEEFDQNFDTTIFDCPVIESDCVRSDAESLHSSKSTKKRKKSLKRTPQRRRPKSEPFLAALIEKDCISDGTISADGVAKLEKLFPEMRTMTWSDCQFKCDKCSRTFNSPQNFFAHSRSRHLEDIPTMKFSCFYCNSKHRREYTLNRHIAEDHFPHLKFR